MNFSIRTSLLRYSAVVTALLVSMAAWAQTSDTSFKAAPPKFTDPARRQKLAAAFPEIDRTMQEFVTKNHVPGGAWGVVIDGELAHTGTAGFREVASKSPVDADTVFRIASMTKSFTAMSILKLRDEGKLSLDDPAEKYVPELKALVYPTADSPRITIRHLLSHSEGFPEDNPWGDRQLADTEEQFTKMMKGGIPFSNAPGVAFEYSNYGFAILGRIVAKASGTSYSEYVNDNILRPLGLASTTLEVDKVPADRLAHGYRWEDDQWKEEPQLANGTFGAMGGMLTSIRDLSKYVSVYLDAWPPRDDAERGPIRRASLREMQQVARFSGARITRNAENNTLQLNAGGYAYGLGESQSCAFQRIISHGGGLPGFGSTMRWLPEYGVGIIALGNLTYTRWGPPAVAAMEALARTGGLQPRSVQPAPTLSKARDAVSQLVNKWDDKLADDIAAENLFLDKSKDRRRKAFEELHAKVGACKSDGPFEMENPLRGKWLLNCERGTLQAELTLAPTMPPLVQRMEVKEAKDGKLEIPETCEK
jgi:CubicO group peptidase (beta-lactamase class C family)